MSHIRRIEPRLDAFFLRRPKAPYGVKRLEPELEPGQTFGYYNPPTAADPSGTYYFNGSKLEDRSLLNAAALIYHELVPGHHFQISLAYENEAIPAFRRETFDTRLHRRLGRIRLRPGGRDGYVRRPLRPLRPTVDGDVHHRAARGRHRHERARLVAGEGGRVHDGPRTDGDRHPDPHRVAALLRATFPARPSPTRWVRSRSSELREKARAALGDRFDVRRFHDAVLGSGIAAHDDAGAPRRLVRRTGTSDARRSKRESVMTMKTGRRASSGRRQPVRSATGWRPGRRRGRPRRPRRRRDHLRRGGHRRRRVRRLDGHGTCSAPGARVALLDAYGPGSSRASSGGESRVIRMGYGDEGAVHALVSRSLGMWKELAAADAAHPLYHETGVLWMARGQGPARAGIARRRSREWASLTRS